MYDDARDFGRCDRSSCQQADSPQVTPYISICRGWENLSATGPCFNPNFYGQFGKTETVVDHRP